MIDFYDLIESSIDNLMDSYINETYDGISILLEENINLTPVNESSIFTKVKETIINFIKKIGSFIKKWWNKLLRFLGIGENKQEKEDNTTTTDKINDDAEKTIENSAKTSTDSTDNNPSNDNNVINNTSTTINDEESTEKLSPEQMRENLQKDREKFIELCDSILTKGRESIVVKDVEYDIFKYNSYSITDNNFGLDTEEKKIKLYKYCIENTNETDFYVVDIDAINDVIAKINNETKVHKIGEYRQWGNKAPMYVKYITYYEYQLNNLYDYATKNNIDKLNSDIEKYMGLAYGDDNKIYSNDPDIEIYNLENKYKLYDHEYKTKYLYKVSSTNNYYILRYAMLTSNISFVKLLEDVYKLTTNGNDFEFNKFGNYNYMLLKITKIMEENKDKIPDVAKKINFLKNWHLKTMAIKNKSIISKLNLIGKIQNDIRNANRSLINKYIREANIYG